MDNNIKSSGFIKKYIVFVIVLFAAVAAVLFAAYKWLENYQAKYDKTLDEKPWINSQAAFEEYMSGVDIDGWADIWFTTYPGSLDDRELVKSKLQEYLSGEVEYTRGKNYSDESPVYVVETDRQALADFSMSKDASGRWIVDASVMRISGTESNTITVPSACTVSCGGTVLDESYVTASESRFMLEDYYGQNLTNPVLELTYTVSNQLFKPEFTVTPQAGTEIGEDYDGRPILLKASGTDAIVSQSRTFFDAYQYYCMLGWYETAFNAKAAADLCRPDSQVTEVIYGTVYDMSGQAPCYSIYDSDVTEGKVIVWADNAVSVDIQYNTIGRYGLEENHQSGTLRIYLVDFGNGYEICGIENKVTE